MKEKILQFIIKLCRFNFDTFDKTECEKFLRMGLIFAVIVGIYATLQPLKDSIFIQFTNASHLPYAKILSIFSLIPLIMQYTKFLTYISPGKLMMILPAFYGMNMLYFSIILFFAENAPECMTTHLYYGRLFIGYAWYIFIASYGYFLLALFWAFSANITDPLSAKKGFPLIVAIGHIGGIIFPYSIGGLPHYLGFSTDTLPIIIIGILSLILIPLIHHFLKSTPEDQPLTTQNVNSQKHKHSLLDGLKLSISHRYLIGIFVLNSIHEMIVSIFDFNFKLAAAKEYTGVALSNYLSMYISSSNAVSLLFLLIGISNITRFLGIKITLSIIPVIMGIFLYGLITADSLPFLFALIVGAEAIDYSLNGPTLGQLYIPTTKVIRFKAQAWIEILGPASSPGSFLNMLLGPLQRAFGECSGRLYYHALISIMGFPLLTLWFMLALYVGRTFHQAVQEKKTIC